MPNVLYIRACPRGPGASRTQWLGDGFARAVQARHPGTRVRLHDVPRMGLLPIDGDALAAREALIDARAWERPRFAPARELQAADALIIAAPYWDLMFPAMLKVYIEHVFIRELTFCYRDDRPIGLCKARRAVFLTTAGSPIAGADFGTDYLRATLAMLGVDQLDSVRAEGLDLAGTDADAILRQALREAEALADVFWD